MSSVKRSSFLKDYKITNKVLGDGASGKVVSCINLRTQKEYALKVGFFALWASKPIFVQIDVGLFAHHKTRSQHAFDCIRLSFRGQIS